MEPRLIFKVNIHDNTVSLTLLDEESELSNSIQRDAQEWLLNQIINDEIVVDFIKDRRIVVKSGGSVFTKNKDTGKYENVPEEKIKRV